MTPESLRDWLGHSGASARQVAARIGVSKSRFQRWLDGAGSLAPHELDLLAKLVAAPPVPRPRPPSAPTIEPGSDVAEAIKSSAQQYAEEALAVCAELMRDAPPGSSTRIDAAKTILAYSVGKPTQAPPSAKNKAPRRDAVLAEMLAKLEAADGSESS